MRYMPHPYCCMPVWGWPVLYELAVDPSNPNAAAFTGAAGAAGAVIEYFVDASKTIVPPAKPVTQLPPGSTGESGVGEPIGLQQAAKTEALSVQPGPATPPAGPTVTVIITRDGASTTWKDTAVAPGFHEHHCGPLPAAAKVTLSVTDAMARLRWCEIVRC
jgi:hypothetical protein